MQNGSDIELKLDLLAGGVRVDQTARDALASDHGALSVGDYPTTGGVTFELPGGAYVNAPFDGPFAGLADWTLHWDRDAGTFLLRRCEESVFVRPLPMPGYVGRTDSGGYRLDQVVMTHADRFRLSPVAGCAFKCMFCDSHAREYRLHDRGLIDAAVTAAMTDACLPPRHALISGGTPCPEDTAPLVDLIEELVDVLPLPVDVMCTPSLQDADLVRRFAQAGGHELSINIELFGEEALRRFAPHKAALGRNAFSQQIEEAVERLDGRVRSLIILGLEPLEDTMKGVAWLCQRGCQPVLSPFRPASDTPLAGMSPPSRQLLLEAWDRGSEIAGRYGLALGPRCIPCQNNCLAFPPGADRQERSR